METGAEKFYVLRCLSFAYCWSYWAKLSICVCRTRLLLAWRGAEPSSIEALSRFPFRFFTPSGPHSNKAEWRVVVGGEKWNPAAEECDGNLLSFFFCVLSLLFFHSDSGGFSKVLLSKVLVPFQNWEKIEATKTIPRGFAAARALLLEWSSTAVGLLTLAESTPCSLVRPLLVTWLPGA